MSGTGSATVIAAVVVSYRSADTLDDCLQRLRAATGVGEIVVVDNDSDDSSLTIAEAHASADTRVAVVRNETNAGFGMACNLGTRNCRAPYIAFVNPDCWVESDSLARMCRHLVGAPNGGLIGADLVDVDGCRDPAARRFEPTLARMLQGAGSRVSVAIPRDATLVVQGVDAVSGALMLMPRMLFDALDGFDEAYRLHAEDLDLCRRVRDAGRSVLVANDVRVTHVRGVSSRTRPLFVEWHKHRGLWRYFRKFEGRRSSVLKRSLAAIAIAGHLLIAAPRALLRSAGTTRPATQR